MVTTATVMTTATMMTTATGASTAMIMRSARTGWWTRATIIRTSIIRATVIGTTVIGVAIIRISRCDNGWINGRTDTNTNVNRGFTLRDAYHSHGHGNNTEE